MALHCFEEALARDPWLEREWVYLVDGNKDQLQRGLALGKSHGVTLTIVVDFIHVLEYLWKAAGCFHDKGDNGVEAWVLKQARAVLDGNASSVAGAIKRPATMRKLAKETFTAISSTIASASQGLAGAWRGVELANREIPLSGFRGGFGVVIGFFDDRRRCHG